MHALGEFCAENCSVFGAENLKNRCRKCKKSVADSLPRTFKSSARQPNVQMRLRDLRNAECTRNPKMSAKKCCDSGAKKLKSRRRKRKNFVSKTFLCIPNAAHGHTKTRKACKWDLLACKTPNARARRILRGKLQLFRRRKFEKSTPQTQKIGCKQVAAHFKKQHTANECVNAIA